MNSFEEKSLTPYKSLINTNDYENFAIILLIIGFALMSYFFMYFI